MSSGEDGTAAENSNGSYNKVMNDDDDDVNVTKSSSRASTPVEAVTSGSRSRTPPPVTVLPICCILDPEKGLFRVTRSKGKTLAAGGFGITISEPGKETNVTAPPVDDGDNDNSGEIDSHQNDANTIMEDVITPTPMMQTPLWRMS